MKKTIYILFFFYLLIGKDVCGQTIAGGEIYYELVSPLKYKITAHVYRYCQGPSLNTYNGYVYADGMNEAMYFSRTSIQRINDTCGNPCNNVNNSSNPGYERHSLTATVDFNTLPYKKFVDSGRCMISFAIKQGGRDNATNTTVAGGYYLESATNICLSISKNHSPIFSVEPRFLLGCNQPLNYSSGPLDSTDYDSLAFSSEPILEAYKTPIAYKGGFSENIPLTPYCPPNPGVLTCRALPNAKPPRGFSFGEYGELIFTPIVCNEKGYVRIKVREYRKVNGKMELLGYVSREMLMTVKQVTDNNPSTFSGIGSANFFLCNDPVKLTLKTLDNPFLPKQTTYDTTYIDYDNGYSNSKFTLIDTAREKSIDLILYPDSTLYNKWQYFTISTYDKLCNIDLNSRTFKAINTGPIAYTTSFSIDSCKNFIYQFNGLDSLQNIETNVVIYNQLLQSSGFSTGKTGIIPLHENGRLAIQFYARYKGASCAYFQYDTIQISDALPTINLNMSKDTLVCSGYQGSLQFSPAKIPLFSSLEWNILSFNQNKYDTLINTIDSQINFIANASTIVKLVVRDQRNCFVDKQIRFNVKTISQDLIKDVYANVCSSDSLDLQIDPGFKLTAPIQYHLTSDALDTVFNSSKIRLQSTNQEKIYLRATDALLCSVDDSATITPWKPISFKLKANQTEICKDSLALFKIDSFSHAPKTTLWMNIGVDTVSNLSTTYTPKIKNNGFVKVVLSDSNGCKSEAVAPYTAVENPTIYSIGSTAYCPGDSSEVKLHFNGSAIDYTIEWEFDGKQSTLLDSQFVFKEIKSSTAKVTVGNAGKCFAEKTKVLVVFPSARKVRIVTDTFYNPLNSILLRADTAYYKYSWFNNGTGHYTNFWAADLGPPGKYWVTLNVIDKNGCKSGDSLFIYTDRRLSLNDTKTQALQFYPNPVQDVLTVVSEENTSYELFNSEGKHVRGGILNAGETKLNVNDLSTGTYLLKVGNSVYSFIKL